MAFIYRNKTYSLIRGLSRSKETYEEVNESEFVTSYVLTGDADVTIELVGGGGGAGQTDGGVDRYIDTPWAFHFGHNGGSGGHFKGVAHLSAGTITLVTGGAGSFIFGSPEPQGNGGDSYAIFTPQGSSTGIEIARAGGGHGGNPDGNLYNAEVPGGVVTYNLAYFTNIMIANNGSVGVRTWVIKI